MHVCMRVFVPRRDHSHHCFADNGTDVGPAVEYGRDGKYSPCLGDSATRAHRPRYDCGAAGRAAKAR